MRRTPSLIVITALAAACDAPEPAWQTIREQAGDTTFVRTLSADTVAALAEVREELSIGQVEGEDGYMLGSVTLLAVAADGTILAYDRQVPALRAYDAGGGYLRTLGGPGSGPGEYRGAHGLAITRDGRVLLYDPPNARVNVYDAGGQPAGEWRFISAVPPLILGAFVAQALTLDSAGHVYVTSSVQPPGPDGSWAFAPVRHTARGELLDSLTPPDYGFERALLVAESGTRRTVMAPPYSPTVLWTVTPAGRLATALSRDYRIDIAQADGTVLRIEKEQPRVGIDAEERSRRMDDIAASMRRVDSDWRWSGPPFPQDKPLLRALQAGDDGRIWVLLHQPSILEEQPPDPARPDARPRVTWRERDVYDVFEADGVYLGRVVAPDRTTLMVMRGDLAWGIARDSLDVQSIRRYRIRFATASSPR